MHTLTTSNHSILSFFLLSFFRIFLFVIIMVCHFFFHDSWNLTSDGSCEFSSKGENLRFIRTELLHRPRHVTGCLPHGSEPPPPPWPWRGRWSGSSHDVGVGSCGSDLYLPDCSGSCPRWRHQGWASGPFWRRTCLWVPGQGKNTKSDGPHTYRNNSATKCNGARVCWIRVPETSKGYLGDWVGSGDELQQALHHPAGLALSGVNSCRHNHRLLGAGIL